MKSDLQKAKEIMETYGDTCVLCRGDVVFTSTERGIKPLVEFIDNHTDMKGFSAADKIVGKAAAMLYVILGVKAVYSPVMSETAAEVFKNYNIVYECDELTQNIINRNGNGICPMEETVKNISDPREGFAAVKGRLKNMGIFLSA